MDQQAIDEFAKALVQSVRDPLIKALDNAFINQGPYGRRWRQVADTMPARQAILEVMPEIVDETIGQLLTAIEEGSLPLFFRSASGRMWDLGKEGGGEFTGYYASADWVAKFTSQRYTDYWNDPALDPDRARSPEGN